MKRLIKKSENTYDYSEEQQPQYEQQDDFLGKNIEIIYNKSKWFGYNGKVDSRLRPGNKYVVYLDTKEYEQGQKPHRVYISKYDAFKWMNIITQATDEVQPEQIQ